MFDAEEKHNKEHLPNLALPTAEQQVQASTLAITGTSVQNDTRPKQVENWKFETFNSVMFVPDGESKMLIYFFVSVMFTLVAMVVMDEIYDTF